MQTTKDICLLLQKYGGHHLWDEKQAESDGHGQMSVSKKQDEHPVGVQPSHQGEPAAETRAGVIPLGMKTDSHSVIRGQRSTAQPHIDPPPPSLSPSSIHTPPTFNSSICHRLPLRSPFPPIHQSAQQIVSFMFREHRKLYSNTKSFIVQLFFFFFC